MSIFSFFALTRLACATSLSSDPFAAPFKPGGWRRDEFPRNRPSMMAGRWNRPPAHYDNPYDEGPPRFDDRGPPPPEFEHPPPYDFQSLYHVLKCFYSFLRRFWDSFSE